MATRTQHWTEFRKWCVQRKLRACPAHPWTIAAYLRVVDRRAGTRDAQAALDAISREHILKTMRTPMRNAIVVRTMEMIERRGEVRDRHAALFDEQDLLDEASRPAPAKTAAQLTDQLAAQLAAQPAAKSATKPGRRVLSSEPRLKSRRPAAKR